MTKFSDGIYFLDGQNIQKYIPIKNIPPYTNI